jgi:hypothetical protein
VSLVTFVPTSSCVHCVLITNYHIQVASCDIIFISDFMKSSQQLEERQLNWLRVQLFWCTELYCSITGYYLFTEELDPLLVHARTWDNILVFLIHVLGLLVPGASNHSSCPSIEIIDFKIAFNKFLFIWLYMLKFVE